MAIEISTLANLGEFDIELGVANPRTSGVSAGEGAIGYATDNTRWVKVGAGDTDWEQILISTNGEFVANFELASGAGIVPDKNVLSVSNEVGGVPTVGDGETTGGRRVAMSSDLSHITHFGNVEDGVVTSKYIVGELVSADVPSSIEHATIGKGVTSIGSYAFYGNSLNSITIPNSVTSIGSSAFYGNSLNSITIPDSVTWIGSNAFYGNTDLATVNCHITKTVFDGGSNILNGTNDPLTLNVRVGDSTWDGLIEDSPTSYQGNANVTVQATL